eukprot:s1550_g15.t1
MGISHKAVVPMWCRWDLETTGPFYMTGEIQIPISGGALAVLDGKVLSAVSRDRDFCGVAVEPAPPYRTWR